MPVEVVKLVIVVPGVGNDDGVLAIVDCVVAGVGTDNDEVIPGVTGVGCAVVRLVVVPGVGNGNSDVVPDVPGVGCADVRLLAVADVGTDDVEVLPGVTGVGCTDV